MDTYPATHVQWLLMIFFDSYRIVKKKWMWFLWLSHRSVWFAFNINFFWIYDTKTYNVDITIKEIVISLMFTSLCQWFLIKRIEDRSAGKTFNFNVEAILTITGVTELSVLPEIEPERWCRCKGRRLAQEMGSVY